MICSIMSSSCSLIVPELPGPSLDSRTPGEGGREGGRVRGREGEGEREGGEVRCVEVRGKVSACERMWGGGESGKAKGRWIE